MAVSGWWRSDTDLDGKLARQRSTIASAPLPGHSQHDQSAQSAAAGERHGSRNRTHVLLGQQPSLGAIGLARHERHAVAASFWRRPGVRARARHARASYDDVPHEVVPVETGVRLNVGRGVRVQWTPLPPTVDGR